MTAITLTSEQIEHLIVGELADTRVSMAFEKRGTVFSSDPVVDAAEIELLTFALGKVIDYYSVQGDDDDS